MPLSGRLRLDEIVSSFPELGPTIPDGGYAWLILFGTFLIQMTVPTILSMYGVVLGYLTGSNEANFDLWSENIILTPILFTAFWSFTDPWSKIIADLASVPRIVGLIGVILMSTGVLASGYLATGGVGAYLASLSAGAVMGIGASFVIVQSEECLRKYFRIRLPVALTLKNVAYSLGQIFVPSLTYLFLTRVCLKASLFLLTTIFVPTVVGVLLLRRTVPERVAAPYRLLLSGKEDNELPIRITEEDGRDSTEQKRNLQNRSQGMSSTGDSSGTGPLFAEINNDIFTYDDTDEDIFVRSESGVDQSGWKQELRIFSYFRFWAVTIVWIGVKAWILFFWTLLPSLFVTRIPSAYSNNLAMTTVIAGFATLVPSLGTAWFLCATAQTRRVYLGVSCWIGSVVFVALGFSYDYLSFITCAVAGGISAGVLSVCQDSAFNDVLGLQFAQRSHKAFSTVVGLSLLLFCFIYSVALCLRIVAFLQFIGGCYWLSSPIVNIVKSRRGGFK